MDPRNVMQVSNKEVSINLFHSYSFTAFKSFSWNRVSASLSPSRLGYARDVLIQPFGQILS